jgi:LysM repeat protein
VTGAPESSSGVLGTIAVCPFLGIQDEPQTRALTPVSAHRCFRANPPLAVSLQHQAVLCLSDRYTTCSRYQLAPRPHADDAAVPRSRTPVWQFVTLAGAVFAGAAAVFAAVGNPFTAEPAPSGAQTPPATSFPVAAAGGSVQLPSAAGRSAALPSTTAPVGTIADGPPAAPGVAAATPAGVLIYRVLRGENLTVLSQRYHVSLNALAAANGLPPTAGLREGQQLRIPVGPTSTPTPARP